MTREDALKVIRGEINLCEEESVDALELEEVYSLVEHSVPLDRIKQLREEVDKLADDSMVWGILANAEDSDIDAVTEKINECYRAMIFPLIDKLIAESGAKNEAD